MKKCVHNPANKSGLDVSVLEDDRLDEPDVENIAGSFGDFELVGHGEQTNSYCGKFRGFWGCNRVELHNKITLKGENYKDKVYMHKVFFSCDKPSCPVCYKYGWASREARKIEVRLAEASKRFGLAEHVVATVPPKFYGLNLEALRIKIVKVLKARGVIGGVLIFHGFRYNLRKSWYWSPHFHVLGFILGGYPCRSCKKTCFKGCGEFEDRKYRCFEKDGCIVRVLGKRKTVGGTAWYQLHHASIKKGVKRFQVATWFGVVSYRKLKVTVEYKKRVCPICQHDLGMFIYHGVKRFVLDRDSPDFRRDSFEDFEEDGVVVWVQYIRNHGSGSYEGDSD